MNRNIDKIDIAVSSALAAFVVAWAFIWAHPFPHPDMWPFLAALQNKMPLSALALVGKLGLGLFAAVAYLTMRGLWHMHRDDEDDLPDAFFFTRFAPMCAAATLTFVPYVWRSAQFAAPGFLLCVVALLAVWLWQCYKLYGGMPTCFFAYLLLAFVSGITPIGLIAFFYAAVSDIVMRWQNAQAHGQSQEDLAEFARSSTEASLSLVATVLGLAAGIMVGAFYSLRGFPSGGVIAIALAWWRGWVAAFWPMLTSPLFIALLVAGVMIVSALALGRRIRATGEQGKIMATVMAALVGVLTLAMALRAVDLPERRRLAMVGDYVRQTVADAKGVKWLFTDGRFDDALHIELNQQGIQMTVLDALNAPSAKKATELRCYAPEPGDRDMFASGGAEVLKAWARERPDRLADAAWQFGGGIIRRFGKTQQRTCGTLLRSVREDAAADYAAHDRAFEKFSEELLSLLERPVTHGIPFGSVDDALAAKCDAMLWRAARQAGERSDALATAGNINESQRTRVMIQKLDGCNMSLRSQGNMLEKLLPTANLVLTPRESLDIALRRADFFLGARYANEVLVSAPDDCSAHFALAMHALELKDYFVAVGHFERMLKTKPNEPAVLNNLAIAYLKLDMLENALEKAELAAKINPKSKEIQSTLAEIKKAAATK